LSSPVGDLPHYQRRSPGNDDGSLLIQNIDRPTTRDDVDEDEGGDDE
jgi:hypothetical protein